ncbi:hypothetical protein FACS1894102_2370 [Spirochaetia bacterium]|nr:hypothetical protein FACS1894102_2370 [Spirochaetia bacterium]
MAEGDFLEQLQVAVYARSESFERTELPKLKNDMRIFLSSVASLYNLFVQKGHITEDPYKNETKTNDLMIPDTSAIPENAKADQLGLRLSALSNELDFLCNFYDFSLSGFSQNKIKIILGLIRYIDWMHINTDSQSANTKAFASTLTEARRSMLGDPISAKLLTDSLSSLEKTMPIILNSLKNISDFNRELYKLDVRQSVTSQIPCATAADVKKAMAKEMGGVPFYQELIEEILKEDKVPDLQAKLLKKIMPGSEKDKAPKQAVNLKPVLIDGLNALGSAGTNLSEILVKTKENHDLLQNAVHGFFGKLKKVFAKMSNKDDSNVVYDLEFADPTRGSITKEKLSFRPFMAESEKRTAILTAMAPKGTAEKKLSTMSEKQLIEILQLNIKSVQKLHSTLSGLDEYFKKEVDKADRSHVKGIKPELSALKNALAKAQEKLQDYNAHKEEEEQFKRLGIDV